MTLFEYITAGYVLLLSFAILRALSGVPHAVRSQRRYWVYISWLFMAIFSCFGTFVTFWSYREVEWTSFLIIGALAVPASLYAYNSVLVPPDPSTVTSWRDYFYDVRAPLFATGIVLMSTTIINVHLVLDASPLHVVQLLNYGFLGMYAIGLASAKPNVHVALAIAFPCLVAVSVALFGGGPPDSFFRATLCANDA